MKIRERIKSAFVRRPPAVNELEKILAWEAAVYRDGYLEWMRAPPPQGIWIEAVRLQWPSLAIWRTGNEPDEMNVCGLFWRQITFVSETLRPKNGFTDDPA